MSSRWVVRLYCDGQFPGCSERVLCFGVRTMTEAREQLNWTYIGEDHDYCANCAAIVGPAVLVEQARRWAS